MKRPSLVLVVAVADNGVIGHGGTMPWHISADFRRVKAQTMGKPLVMGRKTFDSLPGILPGRRHIVISRDPAWEAEGTERAGSLAEALALANAPEIVIFGGAQIYAEALPLADRITRGQRSLLFGHHADYAAVTMAAHPGELLPQFERPLYHLADSRLLMAYAKALAEVGDLERARHVAARLREFHNPASDAFFALCSADVAASAAGTATQASAPQPFQCDSDPGFEAKRLRPLP